MEIIFPYAASYNLTPDRNDDKMQNPLQITFKNMDPSEALKADVRDKAEKLERFCNQIISCRVLLEAESQRHRQGNLYHVSVDIKVPDGEIYAGRSAGQRHSHEDVYIAIRDAFDHARRQLEDYNKRRQHL
jgi:ribosomal subunit interface protein